MATDKTQTQKAGPVQITATEFEDKVFAKEGIRIVIRAMEAKKVPDYRYTKKSAGNNSVCKWIAGRIEPLLSGLEIEVINGRGERVNLQAHMDTVRNTYAANRRE